MDASNDAQKPTISLNRRDFFKRAATWGASVGAASWALSACSTAHGASADNGSSEEAGASEAEPTDDASTAKPSANPDALDCTDTSGLTSSEIEVRERLKYVDQTPKPEQDCANCLHWKPASDAGCGGCGVMAGPIHPKGWCIVWVKTRS